MSSRGAASGAGARSEGTAERDLLLACVIARRIRDGETVAVGTLSPVPAAGALLAAALHAPGARLLIHGDPAYPFRNGSKEFFDFAQAGRVDCFFLSGAQIDRRGNINLTAVGDYARPDVRLPGGAGSGMLYSCAKRVILFKLEHDRRGLVERVDFVTSAGQSPEGVLRRGGPDCLVTPLALFTYDPAREELLPAALHPGVSATELQAATGWPLGDLDALPRTPPPSAAERAALAGPVRERLAAIYPRFAATLGEAG